MKCQNKLKITLSIGIITMAMFIGGCQSQDHGTENKAVVTRSPTRSDLIKEGKIKAKKKTDIDEGITEGSVPDAAPSSEIVQQSEEPDIAVTEAEADDMEAQQQNISRYILNTNTKLFHEPSCEKVSYIAPHNYEEFNGTRNELIGQGYSACYTCDP